MRLGGSRAGQVHRRPSWRRAWHAWICGALLLLRAVCTPPGFMVVPARDEGVLDVVICTAEGLVHLSADQGDGAAPAPKLREGCPFAPIAAGLPPELPVLPLIGLAAAAEPPLPPIRTPRIAGGHGWRARAPPSMAG